jgi:hypothetical protein
LLAVSLVTQKEVFTEMKSAGHTIVKVIIALIILLAVCYSGYVVAAILTAPPEYRVQFVPDDAYYYMTLARNFATQGRWTFDTGVSLTSGFHPLHAYVLTAVYSVAHFSTERFAEVCVLISYAAALPAILVAASFAARAKRLLPGLLLLLLMLSRNVSLNLVSGVEWGWVVSFSALYCLSFGALDRIPRKFALAALCVCGFLGSLARTDFGLLPTALVVASLPGIRTHHGRSRATAALLGLAFASAGLVTVFLHNYAMTGQWLQSSARMKNLWLVTYGPSAYPILLKTLSLFGNISLLTLILSTIALYGTIICGVRAFRRAWCSQSRREAENNDSALAHSSTLWFASLFAVIGYIAFYSLNPAALQNWYTANLVVPIFLLAALPTLHVRENDVICVVLVVLLVVLTGRQAMWARGFLESPEWPHQLSMYRAGNYLRGANLECQVGSWNAGIIGYYEGGHVINLDGLVNNDIYEYVKQNRLPDYVDKTSIGCIVDFENMVLSTTVRRRGGYDSPDFLDRLVVVRRFDDSDYGWRRMTLYKVIPRVESMTAQSELDN